MTSGEKALDSILLLQAFQAVVYPSVCLLKDQVPAAGLRIASQTGALPRPEFALSGREIMIIIIIIIIIMIIIIMIIIIIYIYIYK